MGLLSGFLGGALGQGLSQVGANMNRRDELTAQAAERAAEKKEDRKLREELLRAQLASRGGAAGNAGARGSKVLASEIDIGALAKDILGRDKNLTGPEVEQAMRAVETGENPYSKQVDRAPGEILDPRDAQAGKLSRPDDARFREIVGAARKALVQARTGMGSDAKEFAEADNIYRKHQLGDAVTSSKMDAGKVATGEAAADGKELYKESGGTVLDVRGGSSKATAVGDSMIRENNAQAGQASAAAGKSRAEADNVGKDRKTSLIGGYKDAAELARKTLDSASEAVTKAELALQKARTKPAIEAAQAALNRALEEHRTAKTASAEANTRHKKSLDDEEARRPEAPAKPGAKTAGKASVADERQRANAAIAKGADAAQIRKRFKERTGQDL